MPAHGPDIGDDPLAARQAAAVTLAAASAGLAAGFRSVIPRLVERQVGDLVRAWGRLDAADRQRAQAAAAAAGVEAAEDIGRRWEDEAAKPVEQQRRGPLEFLRDVRHWPTRVLAEAGVPPVRRDPFAMRRFPDDVYGLIIERFGDIPGGMGGELQALHLAWGVARATWVKAEQARRAAGGGPAGAAPDSG